jgi:glycine/D-amino acid oxidase-like deaminating enzyme
VETDDKGNLSGVVINNVETSEETVLPATRVLLSAGCWTPHVFNELFKDRYSVDIPIQGLGGHSLVVKAPSEVTTCHSVYTSMDAHSPEMYSRPDGVIYVAGVNHPGLPLPKPTLKAATVSQSLEKLKDIARRLIATPNGEDLEVVREGLCFRPITKRGTPYISRLTDEKLEENVTMTEGAKGGVFVAAGHGPWGISLSLGTGKVVAEMMSGKPLSVDISILGF